MKRPLSVTIIYWLVILLTVWSGLRLLTFYLWQDTLVEFIKRPGPFYLISSAGFWFIISLFLIWSTWTRKRWIRYVLIGTGTALTIWFWFDKLLLQHSQVNLFFLVLLNVFLLILLSVCVLLPNTKIYLTQREAHDR